MVESIRVPGLALLSAALLAIAACGGEQQGLASHSEAAGEELEMATIEGEVFYRERIMIPPDSEVEVQLEDISKADALATVIESVSFKTRGGPPYAFIIEYDPARIEERMRYALRARITSPAGELMFTNTEYIDPFGGNPVRVLVHGMSHPRAVPEPEAKPESAPEVSSKTDEQASDGAIVWILSTLNGKDAPLGAGGKSIELQMSPADSTASGFSGCNRYSGGFSNEGRSTHGTPIKFGPLAGTMMACAEVGELEQAYLQMLGSVDTYRMQGGDLELLSDGDVVASFRPR